MAKAKKTVEKKSKKETKNTVVSENVVVTSEPVENTEGEKPDILAELNEFGSDLKTLSDAVSAVRAKYRLLEKRASRDLKAAQKASAKRKSKQSNRSPSGFVKPTLISSELATFLKKPQGTEMARTEVTREINTYIREHNLQDKENGRKINPDTKLSKLLKLGADDELTYFNLQKYMSPHFAKAGAPPKAD